jgi:hypothetical protein
MRNTLLTLLCLSATTAFAQDTAPDESQAILPGGIAISTSYSLNGPMLAKTPQGSALEEQGYRKSLYQQSAKECADLLDTIATTCTVTNISVSTQITRQTGMTDQIYASGSVTLQVELKD